MRNNNSLKSISGALLFILSPFLAFLYSIFNIRHKWAYWIVGLFFILFMYDVTYDLNLMWLDLDGWHHANNYEQSSISDFFNNIRSAFLLNSFNTNEWRFDSYINIVGIIAKLLGGSYHLFFALVGIVYSIFFVLSIKIIFNRFVITNSDKVVAWCITIWLFMNFSIYTLPAVRFATATWFSIWCTLKLLVDKDKKFLFVLLLSTQIHFSFWFYVSAVYLWYFTRRFEKFWIVGAILSTFISVIPSDFMDIVSQYLPDMFQSRIQSYGEDRSLMIAQAITNSNVRKYLDLLYSLSNFLIVWSIIKNRRLMKGNPEYGVFQLFLFIFTICNVFSFFPDMSRFKSLYVPLEVCCIYMVGVSSFMKGCIIVCTLSLVQKVFSTILGSMFIHDVSFWYSNVISILLS